MKTDEKNPAENVTKNEEQEAANEAEGSKATEAVIQKTSKTNYWLIGVVGFVSLVILLMSGLLTFRFSRAFMGPRNRLTVGRVYNRFGAPHLGRSGSFMMRNSVSGNVTAVSGQSFTLNLSGQNRTVQISSSTLFSLNSANKVTVGDQVTVWGGQDSQRVIQASRIAINSTS